jgi:hypothetical protein
MKAAKEMLRRMEKKFLLYFLNLSLIIDIFNKMYKKGSWGLSLV